MQKNKEELLENLCLVHGLENNQGYADTLIKDIKLFRISCNEDILPLLYNRGFIFIGRGMKKGYIAEREFINTPDDYLMITSPQPIECETCIYDEHSMIGLYVNLDMNRLRRIVSKYNEFSKYSDTNKKVPYNVVCNKRTDEITDVFYRLLKILQSELDSKMLASSILDELYFRILEDTSGYILQQLCEHGSSFSRVSKVIEFIHKNLKEKICIEEMAELAGMSPNNFHRIFKEALNDTPVQYIKKVRLNKARQLILHENMKAVKASEEVGYDSPTQFNREFKRYFGASPGKVKELGYSGF
ncbi:hypothetical protein CRV02_12270 [Arcobacter sp. CECT 8989]|uniref:AraC family transcriptional regulator n=1 Tax=Arcobacter sp. CECT 8989 TaxID=2044509 RepID=UPI00100C183D|nr:AraC family transcriptional regulator [Arcobacter sp. CECT 8989]RXJ98966.1 hypothetical protein CRV02_12270 [Arcobacter sp. CECT 8989]